jgi:response regulator RpfG family c-di-GMP phosphodiesterase
MSGSLGACKPRVDSDWILESCGRLQKPEKNEDAVKCRVLVVDDEPGVCQLLSKILSLEGYDARSCSSGEEALKLMQRESFDLVISDLRMPGMSGLALLEEVRKKRPRSAFMMATGVDDVRVGVEAMQKGASDYLVKPIQPAALEAGVRRTLERKRMETELENYRQNLEQIVDQRTKQLCSAMKRIELTYDETLEILAAALDLRESKTAGHSERVSLYSLEMARALNCSGDASTQIRRGSYLHDIGMIGIPDAILLKAGKLTSEEMAIMQTHVQVGYNIVCRVTFLAGAAEIVLTHHERFDGTGYPQGLAEREIPLASRIFVVADTLDAITSHRPYRRAQPFQAAREEIERESGRGIDPEVVRMFLSIQEQTWEDIRLEVAH